MNVQKTFRFAAVVDFVDITVHLAKRTNAQTVRRHLVLQGYATAPYVTPVDREPGGAAYAFRIRLQDPARWSDVTMLVETVSDRFQLASLPIITSVEIALDAYLRDQASDPALLSALATRFVRTQNHIPATARLSGRWQGDVEPLARTNLRKLDAGRVINIGNKGDPISQRIYVKKRDATEELPIELWRARTEITLCDIGLPASDFTTWQEFKFESLSAHFRFRRVKDAVHPLVKVASDAQTTIGRRRKLNRAGGGTRLYLKGTEADGDLNNLARYALRELSRRWVRAPRAAVYRLRAQDNNCRNTGDEIAPIPHPA